PAPEFAPGARADQKSPHPAEPASSIWRVFASSLAIAGLLQEALTPTPRRRPHRHVPASHARLPREDLPAQHAFRRPARHPKRKSRSALWNWPRSAMWHPHAAAPGANMPTLSPRAALRHTSHPGPLDARFPPRRLNTRRRTATPRAVDLDSKHTAQLIIRKRLAFRPAASHFEVGRPRDQLSLVHLAQREQQLRLMIQPCTDPIQHRRDVFTHGRPVRTGALHLDFGRLWKHPLIAVGDDLHHLLGKPPFQQLD